MLVVAWKLNAENLGFFKFSEWSTGMGSMQYVNIHFFLAVHEHKIMQYMTELMLVCIQSNDNIVRIAFECVYNTVRLLRNDSK